MCVIDQALEKPIRAMIFGLSFPITEQAIRHLHIFHNAPYLPPKILHNLCFSFLLGITTVPREIENNLESGATTVITKYAIY